MSTIRLQGDAEKKKDIYYELDSSDKPIGVGGMGQVFKGACINEKTGASKPVAIKFMYDDLPAQAIERARREASIQLRNDNLVEMLGFIEQKDTNALGEPIMHYHIVSELLTGVSLADLLDGKTTDRDGQTVEFALKMRQLFEKDSEYFAKKIVISVLSGVMALHDAGYIHRDIDPSNIMLTNDEHIKLIDFGIAKQMSLLTTGDRSLTISGAFMGKPEYAAPELILGDIKQHNQTTDIYAIGILLYQCITGHTPFGGARHEIMEKQLKVKLPVGIIKNKGLRKIIAKACEKKQDQRYQTSAQMRVALESVEEIKSSHISIKKNLKFAAVLAGLVIVGGGIAAGFRNCSSSDSVLASSDEFQVQKLAFSAELDSLLHVADALVTEGQNKELDDYEQKLMAAYTIYGKVKNKIKNDSIFRVSIHNVSSKIQLTKNLIDSAQIELANQAKMLESMGETKMAEDYNKRAENIINFINEN